MWLRYEFLSGLRAIYVTHSTCDLSSGAIRPVRPARASVPADVTGQEATDWLQLLWNFVASLVAPDEEEEGIQQLTETFTRKGASSHHDSPFHKDQENKRLTLFDWVATLFIQDRTARL